MREMWLKSLKRYIMLKENDSLVQVKICGLTSMDDVHIIEKYGADYAGMVLYYPKSRRNIDINLAAVLVAQLKKSDIKSVAVASTMGPGIKINPAKVG